MNSDYADLSVFRKLGFWIGRLVFIPVLVLSVIFLIKGAITLPYDAMPNYLTNGTMHCQNAGYDETVFPPNKILKVYDSKEEFIAGEFKREGLEQSNTWDLSDDDLFVMMSRPTKTGRFYNSLCDLTPTLENGEQPDSMAITPMPYYASGVGLVGLGALLLIPVCSDIARARRRSRERA